MPILKTANQKGKYRDADARGDVIDYIFEPSKTPHHFIGGLHVDLCDISGNMAYVAAQFGKTQGVQLRHFVIGFSPWELNNPETLYQIAWKIVGFLAEEYQVVFAVHEDADHLHLHTIINAISYRDGHRYRGTRKEFFAFRNHVDRVLHAYGLSSVRYVSAVEKGSD